MITDCQKLNELLSRGQGILEAVAMECPFCDDEECGSNMKECEGGKQ